VDRLGALTESKKTLGVRSFYKGDPPPHVSISCLKCYTLSIWLRLRKALMQICTSLADSLAWQTHLPGRLTCPADSLARQTHLPIRLTSLVDSLAQQTHYLADLLAQQTHYLADSLAQQTHYLAHSRAQQIHYLADSLAQQTHYLADSLAQQTHLFEASADDTSLYPSALLEGNSVEKPAETQTGNRLASSLVTALNS
jgi:hypothetical protein